MTVLPLLLTLVLPSLAGQESWRVSASSTAVLAVESRLVYQGGPAGLAADPQRSGTNDIVVVKAEESNGTWSWTVLPLSTGTISFIAQYRSADGKEVAGPPVSLEVTEAELAKGEDIADIKGPFRARPALWPWALAAMLFWAAWRGWKRWKTSRRVTPHSVPLQAASLPPEEIAARAIAQLCASGLWENDQAAFYLRLTDILRVYLEARYGAPVTAMTSIEVERFVKDRAHDLQLGSKVRELLSRADLVKFAKARSGPQEGPVDAGLALDLIQVTTPKDAAKTGGK